MYFNPKRIYDVFVQWRVFVPKALSACTPTHVLGAPSLPPPTEPIAASDWFNRSRTRSAVALSHIAAWDTGPIVRDLSPPLTEGIHHEATISFDTHARSGLYSLSSIKRAVNFL